MTLEQAVAEIESVIPQLELAGLHIAYRDYDITEHFGPSIHLCTLDEFAAAEVTSLGHRVHSSTTVLFAEAGLWGFSRWDYCPGPGPSDFVVKSLHLSPLVKKVVAYYSGIWHPRRPT